MGRRFSRVFLCIKDITFNRFIGGMDHDWNDPSVLLAIGCAGEDYYIVEEAYAQHVNVLVVSDSGELEDCLVKRYIEMDAKYHFETIWADPSEPERK
ncbi:hypothetical protein [Paenibacillus sp. URB8-2]|uniref:hypothetical protein n=1 Tax=Paenibacillus sp. URB8-2 TaxID=2741301 RepID=UPI0015C172B3|nr:hypothetical protein [Paenibacillus sp. URB8-2]BCG58256.1 hypothetical protein PUR_16810 [Paenibacillus sp. URB8-2]